MICLEYDFCFNILEVGGGSRKIVPVVEMQMQIT